MQKFFFLTFISLFLHQFATAQRPKKPTSVEIYNDIQKLNFLGSVLYLAAHPDDENTKLISYLTNKEKARTGYLSLTRGDGGQNLIGPEIRELLGVIRTQELLAARNIDGGEQFFTRANDFGYSKNPDETLDIWNKEDVLADVVWAIRKFRPDVIINRFDHRTPGTTHGHHTTSAMLSVEAFDLVNDKNSYPEQLSLTNTWQPKRLFLNTSWWFYGGREKFEKVDKSHLSTFDIGTYYNELGLSNTEIASLSRSEHKSQGFGNTGTRGSQTEYLELIKGDVLKNKQELFEGIDTSWKRVKGGDQIGKILMEVEKNFNFSDPSLSLPKLVSAYQLIQKLEDTHWRDLKSKQIKDLIVACSGLYLEVAADDNSVTQGGAVSLKLEAINRSKVNIQLTSLEIPSLQIEENWNTPLAFNTKLSKELSGAISSKENFTSPYWLAEKSTLGMYVVPDKKLIGLPETPKNTLAVFNLKINDIAISFNKQIIYKTNDPVAGEVYKPFEITPEISVGLTDKVIIFSDANPKQIAVNVIAKKDDLNGKISLKTPDSWSVSPKDISFTLSKKGEKQTFNFIVTPPESQSEGIIVPEATVNSKTYTDQIVTINYDHIPTQTVILPAEAKLVKLDIKKKGQYVGYIEGAGDVVPESLTQIGYKVTTLAPENITPESLKDFDAIVIGIRAYNTVELLKFKQPILLDYVKNGGTLVVQYNTNRRLKVTENLGPYPLKLSRDRVTDENAAVNVLAKNHPLMNTPNKITDKDFEGWVQERGLYFPNEWSKDYTPILSMHDKGETDKQGSLLVAQYGKGHYVYTGLSFFREFPAGVPGAYRLFANILSLGK